LMERSRRGEQSKPTSPIRMQPLTENLEVWDFLEGAIENLNSRERLLSEFRRASRHLLRASHAVFFLKEENIYRADRGSSFLLHDDPIIGYLAAHPLVLDGIDWPGPPEPVAELAVRNRMAIWGARLLIPLHENGHLLGIMTCGVRDDGQSYTENDKVRAVFVARLLKQLLMSSAHLNRLNLQHEKYRLGEKYLPRTLILSAQDEAPAAAPLVVRALIGEVRRSKETRETQPTPDQPFRAKAGLVLETGGVWVFWEEASGEVDSSIKRSREERLNLLREIAQTLNHEIGNSLVSLTTLRHGAAVLKSNLEQAIHTDISRLEYLNNQLVQLAALVESGINVIDFRDIVRQVGEACGVKAKVGPDAVPLAVAPRLLDFALQAILRTIIENRGGLGTKDLTLQLRATGAEDKITALISIKGKMLELEGILPVATPDSVPNQGKMGVFIAKEIIKLHTGSIHAGPGLEGTEILISICKW